MAELDLLNLARAATANEVTWFSQMVTVTFAMIVAIYYFLNQASLPLKIFGFVAYMVGMLMLLGEMLIESNVKTAAIAALRAMPQAKLAAPTQQYIAVLGSWLGISTSIVFNVSFWILWIGTFYLLFFWKKSREEREVFIQKS
jgi:hypothetical protein